MRSLRTVLRSSTLVLSSVFLIHALHTPVQAQDMAAIAAPFRIYLTFEDGPTDAYTPGILDTLAQYGARATFLIGGYQIAGNEDLLQREVAEGHAIVNHLWEEPGFYAEGNPDDTRAAYLRTEEAIRAALAPAPDLLARYDAQVKMFWQPGGSTDPLPEIDGVQAITYNWHVDSDDCGWALPADIDLDTYEFDEAVIDNILNTPVSNGQMWNAYDYGDGTIIAFHDINRVTGRVLPTVLAELASAGATFEALPRPWDQVNTLPVVIGVPPAEQPGIAGLRLRAMADEATSVNLRAEPNTYSDVVSVLPPGANVTAIGRSGGAWIQVDVEGQVGWVSRMLLKVYGPVPSLPQA